MKTKAVIAALILMIGVAQAKASDNGPSVTISHQDGSDIFLVNYRAGQAGNVKMTVRDQQGRELITKSIRDVRAFSLPVNLEDVDAGVYDIEIDNGTEKQTQILDYSNQSPATYTHVTALGGNRYLLSVEHAGSEKIYIRIVDGTGETEFEQEQSINGSFAIVYDLRNVDGSPTFEVSDTSGRSRTAK